MARAEIEALRAKMREEGIFAFIVPSDDYHASEYVGDHFKARRFLSGFTGSAGTLIVTPNEAGLWTDGRYFLQAAIQLEGSGIDLYRSGEQGVPTMDEFLAEKTPEGGVVSFDGRQVSRKRFLELQAKLPKAEVRTNERVIDAVFTPRPPMSRESAWLMDDAVAGEACEARLSRVREAMAKEGCSAHLVAALDDIAWIFNLRGNDVQHTPVALAYALIENERATLFIDRAKLTDADCARLSRAGVELKPYDAAYEIAPEGRVLLDTGRVNCLLASRVKEPVDRVNPSTLMKIVKNSAEQAGFREAHVRDGLALTRFMMWLKSAVKTERVTELSASEKLSALRREQQGCFDDSFETICGYMAHGAIVHYSATPETDATVEPRGLLLVDSGGQYDCGTTDVTRTIAVGELTDEMKRTFTLVLKGTLALMSLRFPRGVTGRELDIACRRIFWDAGLDYNHGTGHGVGFVGSVHEGPNGFMWKRECAPFEAGMVTSDEPGQYYADKFGVRTENLILCVDRGDGLLGFEPLTLAPIDLDAVDASLLTANELEELNRYHALVCETLSPRLDGDTAAWLKRATRPIE